MNDFVTSQIRTYVPLLVGWVLTRLAEFGFVDIDREAVIGASVVVVSAIWYGLFRMLEAKVNPRFGWLLGVAKAPEYDGGLPGGDAGRATIGMLLAAALLGGLLLAVTPATPAHVVTDEIPVVNLEADAADAHGCYTQVSSGSPYSYAVVLFGASHGHGCVGWLVLYCDDGSQEWRFGYQAPGAGGTFISGTCLPDRRSAVRHWGANA